VQQSAHQVSRKPSASNPGRRSWVKVGSEYCPATSKEIALYQRITLKLAENGEVTVSERSRPFEPTKEVPVHEEICPRSSGEPLCLRSSRG